MRELIFILLVAILCSCNSSSELLGKNASDKNVVSIPEMKSSFPVSASTKLFIQKLKGELQASNTTLESFVPSAKFIDDYSLSKGNDGYIVSGFIKTDDEFDSAQLEKLKIHVGKPSGDIRTVRIPLKYFPDFLQEQKITYFEISKKVTLLK